MKINSENFNFYAKEPGGVSRFVISVPKSLDKRASKRNYTRRIIEQVILSNEAKLKKGKLVLIRAKKIINNENRTILARELGKLLRYEFGN